ncbi:hypothetical protein [Tabrizicola sp.]|uniref:hypothetical protein n=1 Tax=Tabrizicola sp. TaxID=2005166 RepID=UPI0035AE46CF
MSETLPASLRPARPSRLSASLKRAIELRIKKGCTVTDACAAAGISTQAYYKAQRRAEVRLYAEDVRKRLLDEASARRDALRLEALEVAADMLRTASSETVKVRLIELLLNEGRPSASVNVNVDARSQVAGHANAGYVYQRPAHLQEAEERP